eukprot:m.98636 g.98636  ORF g.98636 m.98636 type:complete len:346 (-) comp13643_c0_seq1:96-1133(-)
MLKEKVKEMTTEDDDMAGAVLLTLKDGRLGSDANDENEKQDINQEIKKENMLGLMLTASSMLQDETKSDGKIRRRKIPKNVIDSAYSSSKSTPEKGHLTITKCDSSSSRIIEASDPQHMLESLFEKDVLNGETNVSRSMRKRTLPLSFFCVTTALDQNTQKETEEKISPSSSPNMNKKRKNILLPMRPTNKKAAQDYAGGTNPNYAGGTNPNPKTVYRKKYTRQDHVKKSPTKSHLKSLKREMEMRKQAKDNLDEESLVYLYPPPRTNHPLPSLCPPPPAMPPARPYYSPHLQPAVYPGIPHGPPPQAMWAMPQPQPRFMPPMPPAYMPYPGAYHSAPPRYVSYG